MAESSLTTFGCPAQPDFIERLKAHRGEEKPPSCLVVPAYHLPERARPVQLRVSAGASQRLLVKRHRLEGALYTIFDRHEIQIRQLK